jgi:ribokinase
VGLDVLVVGDLNPDLLLSGDVVPRFGQAEQDVDAAIALGGSGGICAAALARLGLDVGIAAAVGDDDLGRLVRARLEALGVATSALQTSARPTGLSVHLLRDDGDRAILTAAGAIADLDVDRVAVDARHVHLASAYLVPAVFARGGDVIAAARAAGSTVSVDTNFDPSGAFAAPGWLLDADILLPNATEARALTGVDDVEGAARALAARGATVAVKLGADGALGVAGPDGAIVRVAAPRAEVVVDAVGAGDAFDAGFLAGRLDGRSLEESLAFACAAGTLSVRDRGERGQATLAEVLGVLG